MKLHLAATFSVCRIPGSTRSKAAANRQAWGAARRPPCRRPSCVHGPAPAEGRCSLYQGPFLITPDRQPASLEAPGPLAE